jgi:hypothetical protein
MIIGPVPATVPVRRPGALARARPSRQLRQAQAAAAGARAAGRAGSNGGPGWPVLSDRTRNHRGAAGPGARRKHSAVPFGAARHAVSRKRQQLFSSGLNYKVWLIVPNRAQSRPEGEQIPRYFLDEPAIFSHRALWIE